MATPPGIRKGRGAVSNPEGRFETRRHEVFDDGWDLEVEVLPKLQTTVQMEPARSIITRNDSPDIPFDQSINPYRGCEHGCIYCYARPSHAYWNLSPGLDFETRLFYKPDAARLLEQELSRPGYAPKLIALGSNTDPYQPIERTFQVTRQVLEVLDRFRHPVGILTKGALIARDIDLLANMALRQQAAVGMSLITLDPALKRTLEPRAASPQLRLKLMRQLSEAGIPVRVMVAPVIPLINDAEIEDLLAAAREAGASRANYTLLRLPWEVKDLFREWLDAHAPGKAKHVMSLVQQMRGGRDNDPEFGSRMRGQGEYARMIAQRFALACKRLGFNADPREAFDYGGFRVPPKAGDQLGLF